MTALRVVIVMAFVVSHATSVDDGLCRNIYGFKFDETSPPLDAKRTMRASPCSMFNRNTCCNKTHNAQLAKDIFPAYTASFNEHCVSPPFPSLPSFFACRIIIIVAL